MPRWLRSWQPGGGAERVGSRLVSVEVRGFRAFGTEPTQFDFDVPIAVVHAGNSQGKTSLAEALEFLISGRSSRRDLLGGAKAEYHDSLRNAHMPDGNECVYVEAVVRTEDGETHQVRRELVCDFGPGVECDSRLFIDGNPAVDLASVGMPLADPPVRAPVLLQHILRHVLSTEPKQRVGYFKALLSLTDLDVLREHVAATRGTLEREPPGSSLTLLDALDTTPAAAAGATLKSLAATIDVAAGLARRADAALLDAGAATLGSRAATLQELAETVEMTVAAQAERAFPLGAFAVKGAIPSTPAPPGTEAYETTLGAADEAAARLAPVLTAVLAVDEYASLNHAVDCPVCGTDSALTPDRMAALREQLGLTRAVDTAAGATTRLVNDSRHVLDVALRSAGDLVPTAATWPDEQMTAATAQLRELGVDPAVAFAAREGAQQIATAVATVLTAGAAVRDQLDRVTEAVSARHGLPGTDAAYADLDAAMNELGASVTRHSTRFVKLRTAVEPVIRERVTTSGLRELADLLGRRDQLVDDLAAESSRRRIVKRLRAAERVLREAVGRVLDDRFLTMSGAIGDWWASIRPEELVGFGGVKRRAGGERFVNLIAALRADPAGQVIERDALGVYSDSQLNALGLSIFLARAELLGTPLVVLDDPIPGSDPEHRLTFVQNTLGRLLDAGIQVVLTTFDGKLADWAQSNHDWRGLVAYELTLNDRMAGTEATQTSDTFSRLLLEAEENLNAPSARGRRAACGSYRAAAERLAKQIIATGRTKEGHPCSVGDVEAEASVLGDLVPLVSGYALDNAERGQWRTFAKVLNPGNHDDDVPSTIELRQVRGNLRQINKVHRKHWAGGLQL